MNAPTSGAWGELPAIRDLARDFDTRCATGMFVRIVAHQDGHEESAHVHADFGAAIFLPGSQFMKDVSFERDNHGAPSFLPSVNGERPRKERNPAFLTTFRKTHFGIAAEEWPDVCVRPRREIEHSPSVSFANPSMTKKRLILLSGAMVRATLDRSKTQTRLGRKPLGVGS
ncbi:hypothetical protein [Cupriavidus sp. HPC(L)]|uniref:hypothetical protein n=1 Tax=Cupriavidus sp. HPC(L) TaxID=1217418 RepID=UPI0012EECF6B|nr:hypothetical protein [Cupriavidus sp. HPC(L)]